MHITATSAFTSPHVRIPLVVTDDYLYNMMLDSIVNFTNAFLFVVMSRPGWAASGAGLPQSAVQVK